MGNDFEQCLVRVDARTAKLEGDRLHVLAIQHPSDCFRHILHIGGLQSRETAPEHRIDWKLTEEFEDGGQK